MAKDAHEGREMMADQPSTATAPHRPRINRTLITLAILRDNPEWELAYNHEPEFHAWLVTTIETLGLNIDYAWRAAMQRRGIFDEEEK